MAMSSEESRLISPNWFFVNKLLSRLPMTVGSICEIEDKGEQKDDVNDFVHEVR